MSPLDDIRRAALQALRTPPGIELSRWIEAAVRLPGSQAEPGPMRLWPFQRAIADSIGAPEVERVSVLKSARIGYTSLLSSVIAYYVSADPSSILVVQPTQSDCRGFVVDDLEPLFEAAPALSGRLKPPSRTPDERSTIAHRIFPGGSLKIVAARAPRNLRRHGAKVLLLDEVDGYEMTAEGDAVALAEKRTLAYRDRKIVCGSTPLFESTSAILRLYQQSDQRIFEVPCHACGGFSEFTWACIEWEPDRPETAAFRCPHCAALVSEREKATMVERGAWRATRPEVRGHHGYRLSSLISPLPNAAWGKLAAEFLAAKKDPDLLRVFVNTVLGEPWRAGEDTGPDEHELASRMEPFSLEAIPPEVLILTAGVDVQDDRFEVSTLGFARDGAVYVLAHDVIFGRPQDVADEAWRDLDDHLRRRFPHPKGGVLKIDACAIDAGDGDSYVQVLEFCSSRYGRRVFAIKGVDGFSRPPLVTSKSTHRKGRLFIVGVDPLKNRILSMIAKPGMMPFSGSLAEAPDYFAQLLAERVVTRYRRGKPMLRLERRQGVRSEAIDCATYALAARAGLTIDLDRREAELASQTSPERKAPAIYRSSWMSG